MPFKSQAQRRKFAELLVQGKITPEQFEEWNRETGAAKLPEHVGASKKKSSAKKKSTSSKKKATSKKKTSAKKKSSKKR